MKLVPAYGYNYMTCYIFNILFYVVFDQLQNIHVCSSLWRKEGRHASVVVKIKSPAFSSPKL